METPRNRRTRRRRSPEYLSMEMILRKSFCDSIKEYLKNCSLAGAAMIYNPDIPKVVRTFWTIIFIAALSVSGYFLVYIWSDTLNKPLIVTMESSTYPIGSTDFPAVAICNINRISKRALTKFALEEYPDLTDVTEGTLEEVQKALLNWGRLINYSYNDTMRTNPIVNRIIEKYRFDNQKVTQIMKMLAPKCEDMFLRCAWNGAIVDCKGLIEMHRIANRGHCCTFNYWSKRLKADMKRQKRAGYIYGLNVMIDPQIEDYAYPLSAMQGFDILIVDPSHFADPSAGRVGFRICEPNMSVHLELKSSKQIASKEVRKYAIKTRKCMFRDENDKRSQGYYSYSSCIIHCRIETIYSLCKCTPYFFAIQDMQIGPVCTLEYLKCLNKYREKLFYLYPHNARNTKGLEWETQNSLSCPHCYPDCELTKYITKSFEVPIQINPAFSEKEADSLLLRNDINITNKCMLSIYHPLPDAILDRLDVVYYWYEVLSNVGGFCGIIIGFSIISLVEIIYYVTIRFAIHVHQNYKKYH